MKAAHLEELKMKNSKSSTHKRIAIGIGAQEAGYLLVSNHERKKWKKVGPFLKGESVNCLKYDNKSGTLLAATHTNGVFVSKDLGKTWKQSNNGLHVRKTWTLEFDPRRPSSLYVGTQYGHVFHSNDLGANWEEESGLFTAPKRSEWGVDWGFRTVGLCIHTIGVDPNSKKKGERFYIVSSGAGPYRTEDQGKTWALLNKGVIDACPHPDAKADVWNNGPSDPEKNYAAHLRDVHKCTHKLVISKRHGGTLYQQNHCGVYRSNDFGESWEDISAGDNQRHGFPIALIENGNNNGEAGSLFTLPSYRAVPCKKHNSCIIGELAVYRSQDQGKNWERLTNGLKKKNHTCVLRDAMTTDGIETEEGIYFGTTTGEVYGSTDLGENWSLLFEDVGRVQGLSSFSI
jgi:photosystem II stability/assembly factor-like uncharacterized protein